MQWKSWRHDILVATIASALPMAVLMPMVLQDRRRVDEMVQRAEEERKAPRDVLYPDAKVIIEWCSPSAIRARTNEMLERYQASAARAVKHGK